MYLSIHLSIYPSTSISVGVRVNPNPPIYPSIHSWTYRSICPYIYTHIRMHVCRWVFIYLSIHQTMCLSIHTYICCAAHRVKRAIASQQLVQPWTVPKLLYRSIFMYECRCVHLRFHQFIDLCICPSIYLFIHLHVYRVNPYLSV